MGSDTLSSAGEGPLAFLLLPFDLRLGFEAALGSRWAPWRGDLGLLGYRS